MAGSDPHTSLTRISGGIWEYRGWAKAGIAMGIVDREASDSFEALRAHLVTAKTFVDAGQVHDTSMAIVRRSSIAKFTIAGCDGLLTDRFGVALLIRTADCLPVFVIDPARRVVGLVHVGWRGLSADLPQRVVGSFHRYFYSQAHQLRVVIGPAIHSCCYEVGQSFPSCFNPFIQIRAGRRTCDLIGFAIHQFHRCGLKKEQIVDTGHCTFCESRHWFSLRREGPSSGRLVSFVMMEP